MEPCPFCEEPMPEGAAMCPVCTRELSHQQGQAVLNTLTPTRTRWCGVQQQCIHCESWQWRFRLLYFGGNPYCLNCYQGAVVGQQPTTPAR